jgi:hypothetical protein
VKVQVTDQKTGDVLPVQTVGINTRTEVKVSFIWTVRKTGTHTFEVKVNPEGATDLKETSYDNNLQTASLKVVPPVPPGGEGPSMMMIIAVVAIVAVVAVVALVLMRRKPRTASPAPSAAPESAEVVEAVAVEGEQK